MNRDGRTTDQGGRDEYVAGAGLDPLGPAIGAVVGMLTATLPLRRECDRLLTRHVNGLADGDDLYRYRTARVRLLVQESLNRGVRHPRQASEVLAQRSRLDFHAILDRGDPFPEPLPS